MEPAVRQDGINRPKPYPCSFLAVFLLPKNNLTIIFLQIFIQKNLEL